MNTNKRRGDRAGTRVFLSGLPCAGFVLAGLSLVLLAGCGNKPGQPTESSEPNDSFASAKPIPTAAAGESRFSGTVSTVGDLDVFELGALATGDRVTIDATTPGSSLDVSIALFDGAERLVYAVDDASNTILDASIDHVIRHDSRENYLAVTGSAFAADGTETGDYLVTVKIKISAATVPEPVGQILLLDFTGGEVDSPGLGKRTVEPFSAAAIAPVYTGDDSRMRELIRNTVMQNYARFDIVVLTTDDEPPPDDSVVSTVYVGGYNRSVFGQADDVDVYNQDYCDDAIVYAETFAPRIFARTPSTEEMAVAIGNIIAHEAGHLLGLNHVSDDLALMDDVSGPDAFLEDQEFTVAPLSTDIMPLGKQDATLLLLETVGPRP